MADSPYVRQLLGDAWVDKHIFGATSAHVLGLWQKKDPNNPWLKYVEKLVKAFFTGRKIKFDPKLLAQKVREDFVPTLAEMESAVFLAEQGFDVTVEPTAPDKGPDLRMDSEGISYFVEVRAVGFSEEEERVDAVSKQVFAHLEHVPSSYHVHVDFGEDYTANTPELARALDHILEALGHLNNDHPKKATLYSLSAEKSLLVLTGDYDFAFAARTEREKLYAEIAQNAGFVARFDHIGAEQKGTSASASRQFKLPPEPVKTHERLKKILKKKKSQLPKESRGILLLETSDLFMLDDLCVESALYGDLVVEFPPVNSAGERVGQPTVKRNNRGFFGDTSRVSAVVIHKRVVKEGEIQSQWKVYPTNRANEDTIQLTVAELRRFGDVGDREHLSADNMQARGEA